MTRKVSSPFPQSGFISKPFGHAPEHGAIMVFMVFATVVLLAMAGLAIDGGNLYRARLGIQKAADAAVLAGVGYTIQLSKQELEDAQNDLGLPNLKSLIEKRAEQVFTQNLRMAGLTAQRCTGSSGPEPYFVYNPANRRLDANVCADVDFLLMDLVPFHLIGAGSAGNFVQMKALSQARRHPANVSLVLDVSGSMGCPPEDALCRCKMSLLMDCDDGTNPMKLDTLVEAVGVFLEYFDERDRIGLVPFSMRAQPAPKDEIEDLIAQDPIDDESIKCLLLGQPIANCNTDALRVGSNSNVCDGFIEAYEDMQQRIENERPPGDPIIDEEVAYVYFSDGAPSAGRFLWAGTDSLPENDPEAYGSLGDEAIRDYIHFSIAWRAPLGDTFVKLCCPEVDPDVPYYEPCIPQGVCTDDGDCPADHVCASITAYSGPSLLVKTQSLYFHWPVPSPPLPNPANPGAHVPLCHNWILNGQPSEYYAPPWKHDFPKVFEGCLSNFGFRVPHDSRVYASNRDITLDNVIHWNRLYYLCAIALSDMLRRNNGTVYVVGTGVERQIMQDDPFQSEANVFHRKDVFLTRVANDYRTAITNQIAQGELPHPENWEPDSELPTYEDWKRKPSPRQGEYLRGPDSSELRSLAQTVAKRIALRLIK